VAESVQFLGGRGEGEGGSYVPAGAAASTGRDADFPASASDDDIPF
jgi:single-stranded DNA-binding protein